MLSTTKTQRHKEIGDMGSPVLCVSVSLWFLPTTQAVCTKTRNGDRNESHRIGDVHEAILDPPICAHTPRAGQCMPCRDQPVRYGPRPTEQATRIGQWTASPIHSSTPLLASDFRKPRRHIRALPRIPATDS